MPRLNLGLAVLRLRKALSKPRTVVRSDDRFLTYFGKLNREQGIALLNNMMARWPSNMQRLHNVAHLPGLLFGCRVACLPPLPSACLSPPRPRPLSASSPAPSALIEVGLPRLNLGPAFL